MFKNIKWLTVVGVLALSVGGMVSNGALASTTDEPHDIASTFTAF